MGSLVELTPTQPVAGPSSSSPSRLSLPSAQPSRSRSASPAPLRPKRSSRRLRGGNGSGASSPMLSSASDSGSVYGGREPGLCAGAGADLDEVGPSSPVSGTAEDQAMDEKRRRELVVEASLKRLEAASMTKTGSRSSSRKSPRLKQAAVPECQSQLPLARPKSNE